MAGDLQYGERGIVESTAVTPTPTVSPAVGPSAAPAPMPAPGAAVEAFAPTQMPRQPITAGLEPGAVPENDPVNVLRAMYRRYPYPEIRRLIERRDMMRMGPMNRNSPMNDSWARPSPGNVPDRPYQDELDPDRSQMTPEEQAEADRRMDEIRRSRTDGRFAREGEDPDQTQMSPEEQAEADRRMDEIRRSRTGGRFAEEGEDPDQTQMSPAEQVEAEIRMERIRRSRSDGRFG